MMRIRPCPAKSHADLAREWDQLAEERHRQIESGEDLSFDHVVVPTTWRLFEGADRAVVLDIGSGTGDFTAQLAQVAGRVIAVDPSRASIMLARRVCRAIQNVRFVEASLEEAASCLDEGPVTAAVAVMTLMTAPDVRGFAKALAALLQTRARFVATLTHPWFWPMYWGYDEEPWFHYEVETFIEAPFVISKCRTEVRTTHIHRPLEQYLNVFAEEGFRLDALAEPMPPAKVQALYPAPWQFPRFLGLRWEKVV
ncbi:MAG TPA: class I SAM-dependent methyltransferase [Methylomirabilota bacterium]|nr:class I SAM-dependent methyltransferase [Methylomirabilota bacterium]